MELLNSNYSNQFDRVEHNVFQRKQNQNKYGIAQFQISQINTTTRSI